MELSLSLAAVLFSSVVPIVGHDERAPEPRRGVVTRQADEAPQALGDYLERMRKEGWRATSLPSKLASVPGSVAGGGPFKLAAKQEVTLIYSWVILSVSPVEPGSKKMIDKRFKSDEPHDLSFTQSGERNAVEYSVARRPASQSEARSGAGIRVRFEVSSTDREEKRVLMLQKRVDVYTRGGWPKLVGSGYLNDYADATIVRKND